MNFWIQVGGCETFILSEEMRAVRSKGGSGTFSSRKRKGRKKSQPVSTFKDKLRRRDPSKVSSSIDIIMVWISPKLLEGYKFTFILWFCTFLIVVPLCAQRWVFSPYFSASTDYKSQAPEIVENLNTRRFFEAENYLWALNPTENEQLHSNGLRTTTKSRMAAVVTTMKRSVKCGRSSAERNCEPHYLQRTMAALDREAKAYFTKGA